MNHSSTLRTARGFTLIELMIVIAIMGILASIALYAYQDYIIRSQVAEGITLSSGPQLALAEWQSSHPNFPNSGVPGNNTSLGLAAPTSINGNYTHSVAVINGGKIELVYGNKANTAIAGTAKKCTLSPITSSAGAIRWQAACGFDSRYLPQAWR
ncbi:pilin [Halothiobacillus diazotrophicus]|uniref:pilin n=1 Tax=Halothiobacillus diazotrophicus TaxID=1860122 RepID=UPI0009EE0570|nr:pilin [Halothiobacillus diazotrophicus]